MHMTYDDHLRGCFLVDRIIFYLTYLTDEEEIASLFQVQVDCKAHHRKFLHHPLYRIEYDFLKNDVTSI